MSKVSVVTGANKGIGYGIVRGLCKQVGGTVILTSRSTERGLEAVKRLKVDGFRVEFEQLDITNEVSVNNFIEVIKEKYGGVDVLCNNAGIAGSSTNHLSPLQRAIQTTFTNFASTVRFTKLMLPLMKDNGRICQVASRAGMLNWVFPHENNPIRKQLLSQCVTEDDVYDIHEKFIDSVKKEDYSIFKREISYSLSKCLLIAHTMVLGRLLKAAESNLIINACCPGYVITDMTSSNKLKPTLTIDEGAETPLYLCSESCVKTGCFYADRNEFSWSTESLDPVYHCN